MRGRDFFTFCNTLKPLELRAIGQLSQVRHLARGEVLYSPGDLSDALYMINRGLLEVVPENSTPYHKSSYLSRGDVIGVEVLSEIARKNLVRAHDVASLQCFSQKNFPELVQQVPSFFPYLCGQMAFRLLNAPNLPVEQSHCLELSGSISTFDLPTIHQTIMSSGQTGELSIKDENAERIGAFYFEIGQPCTGQFQHLTGEEAFWQLFLSETLSGTFSFSVTERPLTNWIQSGRITRNGSELLINALQFRDELSELKRQMPNSSSRLSARAADLHWNGGAPEELKPLAKRIWEIVSRGKSTIGELYRQCAVCELKVYQVLDELLRSKQVTFS